MEDTEGCPYQIIHPLEGLMCFNPWNLRYEKKADEVVERWCRRDYRSCPLFLANCERALLGISPRTRACAKAV